MGSEWPDKSDKTGFTSVARGGGFFRVIILPKLTVWSLGWFEYGTILPMSDETCINMATFAFHCCSQRHERYMGSFL